ncbi:hypothetical protein HLB23_36440 [Nocardia uniformis]|uniref:Uncharacterized protein n=1 Tax=Nocardia uniformis TaxID=53432 RepID=A0A849CK60_9NOCA|nr:hypothetical protein [Nocardia uniformis]NNH75281.1 hypothetical protein [Nocardia uniformis]
MEYEAKIIDSQGDYSLISWEGRRFPALTIQGDSLHLLNETLKGAQSELSRGNIDDAAFSIREAVEQVSSMEKAYGEMMQKKGLRLPY